MTVHAGPMPVPARITWALDARELYGPEVDRACGAEEPAVDEWEAGVRVPTRAQVEALAALTRMSVEYFYAPVPDALARPHRTFICERGRRGDNGLTIVRSWVDWDGVAHIEQETPDRPPYRLRKPRTTQEAAMPHPTTRPGREQPHVATEDPGAPGCCATCRRPLQVWRGGQLRPAANPLHVDHADIPPAPRGPQDRAAGDREDHDA